jgi:hypothetical protein
MRLYPYPTKLQLKSTCNRTVHIFDTYLTISTLANIHVLTVKIRQPSHEFTFGVGISFIPYPLVLTLVV